MIYPYPIHTPCNIQTPSRDMFSLPPDATSLLPPRTASGVSGRPWHMNQSTNIYPAYFLMQPSFHLYSSTPEPCTTATARYRVPASLCLCCSNAQSFSSSPEVWNRHKREHGTGIRIRTKIKFITRRLSPWRATELGINLECP